LFHDLTAKDYLGLKSGSGSVLSLVSVAGTAPTADLSGPVRIVDGDTLTEGKLAFDPLGLGVDVQEADFGPCPRTALAPAQIEAALTRLGIAAA
jgi:hypothetical protein